MEQYAHVNEEVLTAVLEVTVRKNPHPPMLYRLKLLRDYKDKLDLE
jgi:hypothetical protein